MTKPELRELALKLQDRASERLMHGCFVDIGLDGKVNKKYAGAWSLEIRVDQLLELCAAVLGSK